MVGRRLPVAHADGSDLEARAGLMLGAHLAGQAVTLSGLGLVHGIGHALTAHTGTPHGVAPAAVLEDVLEFGAAAARDAYEQTARALRLDPPPTATGPGPRSTPSGRSPGRWASSSPCANSASARTCRARSPRVPCRTR